MDTASLTTSLLAALPELFLACSGIVILMVGVYSGAQATRTAMILSIAAMIGALALIFVGPTRETFAFNMLFVNDGFGDFMKALILIAGALTLIISSGYIRREQMDRFEYPVLIVFSTVGMLMTVSANDLISVYIGFELMSLALYVIAAFRRDTLRSSEAGLKYFLLGALSSGMMLYGMSLVYGFTGTTSFPALAEQFAAQAALGEGMSLGTLVGLVFVVAGMAFKISAVPFHMWTPDVYEGSPTSVTAFFAAAPKVAAMALIVRVLMGPFGEWVEQWQQIVVFVSIASMILGSLAAIQQTNIKRLMAYSSIGHVGYALVGLAAGTQEGIRGVAIYMAIYVFMTVGTFACIMCMRQKERMVEGIEDLKGLSKTHPLIALAMAVFMFSMAGIPPLAGFFAKIYVFLPAVEAGLYVLAVIGVLTSVVACYYYLRIVKLMYFDEAGEGFDRPIGRELTLVIGGTAVLVMFFFVLPSPVVDGAAAAARAFFVAAG
jgi:NADH-quinone oxidoreductase subunit N